MTRPQHTVVFWGAGATASLGIQTTGDQTQSLRKLASKQEESLSRRIKDALGDNKAKEPWTSALGDLLTILGDDDKDEASEEKDSITTVTPHHIEAMRRHWRTGADDGELRDRIFSLRTLYDWPALKAIIDVCPGAQGDRFQLNDLFNVLDMHGQSGHGFRVKEGEFLTPQRVLSARNALKMLFQAMFYIDWQCSREANKGVLEHHYDFAKALGRRMQRRGLELAGSNTRFDSRDFYMGDVSFASFNYDPIALWCQFVANRDLNKCAGVPHIGCPASKLQIFHDLGHFVAGSRIEYKEDQDPKTPWHPMNETSAQRLNDPDHRSGDRIRISKFFFHHGCLWWRECPNCGKLSSYMGDTWEWDSPTLIPPPPLKAFVRNRMFRWRIQEKERGAWERGEVDARACVHCQTLTYAHHTQTIMQSSFKDPPPPFLDEIKRDLRVAVQKADHIVLMGYSLPPDDVDYRAFFAARRRLNPDNPVKCSVVVGRDHGSRWFGPSELPAMLPHMEKEKSPRTTLEAAHDLFGIENVRFYGGGVPNVFLDGGRVTDNAVEKLLTWENG